MLNPLQSSHRRCRAGPFVFIPRRAQVLPYTSSSGYHPALGQSATEEPVHAPGFHTNRPLLVGRVVEDEEKEEDEEEEDK